MEVQGWPGRDEIGIRIPSPVTTGTYGPALHRLVEHPLDDTLVDRGPGEQRIVVADDTFELRVCALPAHTTWWSGRGRAFRRGCAVRTLCPSMARDRGVRPCGSRMF